MTPKQLRGWIKKYGTGGLLLVASYLGWRHLRTNRRATLIAGAIVLLVIAITVGVHNQRSTAYHNAISKPSLSFQQAPTEITSESGNAEQFSDYSPIAVAWDPMSGDIAMSGDVSGVWLLDSSSGQLQNSLSDSHSKVGGWPIEFKPDGRLLAVHGLEQISLVDVLSHTRLASFPFKGMGMGDIVWSRTGAMIVTWDDSGITVCDLRRPGHSRHLQDHSYHGTIDDPNADDAALSPDGLTVANLMGDRLMIWSTHSGKRIETRTVPATGLPLHLAWSPDGKILAAAGDSIPIFLKMSRSDHYAGWAVLDTLRVSWHPKASWWRVVGLEDERAKPINQMRWSPDGQMLAVLHEGGTLILWDRHRHPICVLRGAEGAGRDLLAWSPNGKYIAAGCDKGLEVWDTATGNLLPIPNEWAGNIHSLAWSPDSTRLVLAAMTEVQLVSVVQGKLLATFHVFDEEGKQWVTVTSQGDCVGSPGGIQILRARAHGKTYRERPDLVRAILSRR